MSAEIEFETQLVPARKDLLHFVEDRLNKKVYEALGKDPKKWIEELNGIFHMLTGGDNLVAGVGIHEPPVGDPEFQKLGDGVFLYRGKDRRLRGLWIYEGESWTSYKLGSSAKLRINPAFRDIRLEDLLPENFEPKSEVVKEDRRPILTFDVRRSTGEAIAVYAKGTAIGTSHLVEPPSYRLTNVCDINKLTSREEMVRTLGLAALGIRVPEVIGYYEAPVEEFLFLQKVEGEDPQKFLETRRSTIINQDAQILAALCSLGYRKHGFTDFDDKLFDGKHLYLIDVDETSDLYFPASFDFRGMLLDPANTSELEKFRQTQREVFSGALKDALFGYQTSLTPALEDRVQYINAFYQRVGWDQPTQAQIESLTTFPTDYQTHDSWVSMMMED